MEYLLMIVETRGQRESRNEEDGRALYDEMVRFGGFFLIDCADHAEAIALAEQCPAARFATVEVRECAPCHVG